MGSQLIIRCSEIIRPLLKVKLLFLVTVIAITLGCQVQKQPAPLSLESSPQAPASIQKEPWQEEWIGTLEQAKKEGVVRIYTSMDPSSIRKIAEAFESKFNIKAEFVYGTPGAIDEKLLTERRASLYTVDIYIGGNTPVLKALKPAGVIVPAKPALFLPEVLNSNAWYKNKLPWVDREERWIIQAKGGAEPGEIVINTTLVKKGELSSYYDLLQPKWKGKINMTDPTLAGRGRKWFTAVLYYKSLDMEYMKALAAQQLMLTRDRRLQIEWVSHGKHMVSLLPSSEMYREFLQAGAPLAYIRLKESKMLLGGGSSAVALVDKMPHPGAAKLFLNWFLTKEGQWIFSTAYTYQSFRIDVPTDHLPPEQVREPGVDYPVEDEDFIDATPEFEKFIKDIFGPLLK